MSEFTLFKLYIPFFIWKNDTFTIVVIVQTSACILYWIEAHDAEIIFSLQVPFFLHFSLSSLQCFQKPKTLSVLQEELANSSLCSNLNVTQALFSIRWCKREFKNKTFQAEWKQFSCSGFSLNLFFVFIVLGWTNFLH